MNRLILLVESRIRGDVYVRFGGELPKTHRSNTAGRWMLSLPLYHRLFFLQAFCNATPNRQQAHFNSFGESLSKLSRIPEIE